MSNMTNWVGFVGNYYEATLNIPARGAATSETDS